mmetsp:Transcript_24418/g.51940  ORF Transcript_24418/g.51940 Transcript_24418/m.51940 type:complete len:188 (+) Transcript_24418:578-1141(+)
MVQQQASSPLSSSFCLLFLLAAASLLAQPCIGSPAKEEAAAAAAATTRPNIIIMQPDDFKFLDEWTPPPNNPVTPDTRDRFPYNDGKGLPNIERLRLNGLQMMQAYSSSPMCATSRFSTITGRLPSRSAVARKLSLDDNWSPTWITVPSTKLEDVDNGGVIRQKDCSEDNLAVAMRDGGYQTAMIGA